MLIKNTTSTYGSIARFFHWLVFLLTTGMLIGGFYTTDFAPNTAKATLFFIHKSIGLTVLWLMLLRIVWAYTNPKPAYPSATPLWQQRAARSLHQLLYIALVAMPLSGWILSSAAGKPPNYFGLFVVSFPAVVGNETIKYWMATVHYTLAWIIIAAISLHILAGLKHHFVNQDNVLKRMWRD